MSDTLYIEVRDRRTGEAYVAAAEVPVRIGKQQGVGNAILLDPQYESISRVHGVIERHGGRLRYVDQSTNGSVVAGQPLTRAAAFVTASLDIEIGPFLLTRVSLSPLLALIADRDTVKEIGRLPILPGRGIALTQAGASYAFAMLDRWSQREKPGVLRIAIVDGRPALLLDASGRALGARLNRGEPKQDVVTLSGGDVVTLADRRIEILDPAETYRICNNPACRMLDSSGREENCRHCGYHLAGSGAQSRLVAR